MPFEAIVRRSTFATTPTVDFTHGICLEPARRLYPEFFKTYATTPTDSHRKTRPSFWDYQDDQTAEAVPVEPNALCGRVTGKPDGIR